MKRKFLTILAAILIAAGTQAQVKVGDNPTTIDANSVLEIESTNKGLLMPRLALTSVNNASPLNAFVAGMVVYNTATAGVSPNNVTPGVYYCDGTKWQRIINATTDQTVDVSGLTAGLTSPNNFTGGIFNPSTPASGDFIYVNTADGTTWTYNGSQYVSYQASPSTPWYLAGGTTDAGSNKNSSVYRNGAVAIGATAPDASAKLDVASTSLGLLVPRMTTAQKNAIATPAEGLVVYDTDLFCYSLYANGEWTCLGQDLSSVPGSVLTLDCGSAIKNGQLYSNQDANSVNFIVGYTGSNGGFYDAATISSTGVTGLTANLLAGSFNKTSGGVTFYVTGTPNSTGTASFNINLGGQSCTVSLTVLPPSGLATLTCGSALVTGSAINVNTAINGQTITIPYTNGNGGPYNSATIASSNPQITALLNAGNFAVGSGTLTLALSGTPTTSGSPTVTVSVGGSSCTITLTVTSTSPCTVVAPGTTLSPTTYVSRANADLGGPVGSFTAAGGTYTTLSWALTSLPATGVLTGATAGTGATANINVVAGARGRVFITWTATSTGSCVTTTATSTSVMVIGDAILYSMQTAGCASCTAYDGAAANDWVQVTANEYNALTTGVSVASKGAMSESVMATSGTTNSAAGNYSFANFLTGSNSAITNNGYMLGFSAVFSGVTAGNTKKVKTAVGGSNTFPFSNVGGTLPIATSSAAITRLYWILKRPTTTYTGNRLGIYVDDIIRRTSTATIVQSNAKAGDVSIINDDSYNYRLYQGITTATRQW